MNAERNELGKTLTNLAALLYLPGRWSVTTSVISAFSCSDLLFVSIILKLDIHALCMGLGLMCVCLVCVMRLLGL